MQDGRSEHGEVTQFAKAKITTLGKNRSLFTNLLTYLTDTPSPCLSTGQCIKQSSGKILRFPLAKENIPAAYLHPRMKCVTYISP